MNSIIIHSSGGVCKKYYINITHLEVMNLKMSELQTLLL